jgi:hypothetical protein
VTLMAGTDRGAELPRRVPGAAPAGPSSPVSSAAPTLTEELRQRMLAVVKAERAEAAAREQERAAENRTTELPQRVRPLEPAPSNDLVRDKHQGRSG